MSQIVAVRLHEILLELEAVAARVSKMTRRACKTIGVTSKRKTGLLSTAGCRDLRPIRDESPEKNQRHRRMLLDQFRETTRK